MPGFDGTGPTGTGPIGRRLGPCGQGQSGNLGWFGRFRRFGRGIWGGRWFGRGRGWGFMRWFGGENNQDNSSK